MLLPRTNLQALKKSLQASWNLNLPSTFVSMSSMSCCCRAWHDPTGINYHHHLQSCSSPDHHPQQEGRMIAQILPGRYWSWHPACPDPFSTCRSSSSDNPCSDFESPCFLFGWCTVCAFLECECHAANAATNDHVLLVLGRRAREFALLCFALFACMHAWWWESRDMLWH